MDINNITPYEYQRIGIEFLKNRQAALLADDMGLGKTIQAIFAARELNLKKVLLVAPLSICKQWANIMPESWLAVNYDKVWREKYNKALFNRTYDLIIVDEAHYIKSIKAKRTAAILGKNGLITKTERIWLLTGTPMVNRPDELYGFLRVILGDKLGKYQSYKEYTKHFCDGHYEDRRTPYGVIKDWVTKGATNLEELSELVKPLYLRRAVDEVLDQLPKVILNYLPIIEAKSPDLFNQKLLEYIDEEKSIAINLEVAMIKYEENLAIIKNILEEKDKIVLFGHHHIIIDKFKQDLAEFGIETFTGRDNITEKEKALDSFISGSARILIGEVNALGQGIDGLQKVCNTIIFVEIPYTPALLDQAIARLKRIGQTKPVLVYIPFLRGSYDENILGLLKKKRAAISKTIQPGGPNELEEKQTPQNLLTKETKGETMGVLEDLTLQMALLREELAKVNNTKAPETKEVKETKKVKETKTKKPEDKEVIDTPPAEITSEDLAELMTKLAKMTDADKAVAIATGLKEDIYTPAGVTNTKGYIAANLDLSIPYNYVANLLGE